MDKKPYVIAYDFGTQSVRALIFDNKGNTVGKVKNPFSPAYYSKKPGWTSIFTGKSFRKPLLCSKKRSARKCGAKSARRP